MKRGILYKLSVCSDLGLGLVKVFCVGYVFGFFVLFSVIDGVSESLMGLVKIF